MRAHIVFICVLFQITNVCSARLCDPKDPQCIRNPNGDQSLDQIFERAGVPPIDARTLKSVDFQCKHQNDFFVGLVPCESKNGYPGFYDRTECLLKKRMAAQNSALYEGTMMDMVNGTKKDFGKALCNLVKGEVEKNRVGNSCGPFCHIKVKTNSTMTDGKIFVSNQNGNSCIREVSYIRGLTSIQIPNYFKEKVLTELRRGSLNLVELEGVKPCAEMAADFVRLQIALENTAKQVAEAAGGVEAAKKLSFPMHNSEEPGACSMRYPDDDRANAQGAVSSGNLGRLKAANISLASLGARLLACEVYYRALLESENSFSNPEYYVARARDRLQSECESRVKCKICSDAERTRRANSCYQKNIVPLLRDELKKYDTKSNPEFLEKSGSTHSQQDPFEKSKSIDGILLAFGFLGSRSRRKKEKRRNYYPMVLIAALVLFTQFLSGCGGCGSSGDAGDTPIDSSCNTAQSKGCDQPPACPGGPAGVCDGASDAGAGGGGVGAVQGEMGGSKVAENKDDKNKKDAQPPKLGGGNATAARRDKDSGPSSGSGKVPGLSQPKGSDSSGLTGPALTKSSDGGAGGTSAGSPNGGGAATAAAGGVGEESAEKKEGKIDSTAPGYEAVAGGGGRGAGNTSQGVSFGGSDGPTMGAASDVNYNAGDGASPGESENFEDYLSKNGNRSLFEVVSRRMVKWDSQINQQQAIDDFKKIAH